MQFFTWLSAIFLLFTTGLFEPTPRHPHAEAVQTSAQQIKVFYAGADSSVLTALRIAPNFRLTDAIDQADVFVLNGEIPNQPALFERVASGAGFVLFLGAGITPDDFEALTGIPVALTPRDQAISLVAAAGNTHPILQDILWNSAPQVRERYETVTPISSVTPLVVGHENVEWILWRIAASRGDSFVFNAFLDGYNPQIQEWAYFNYLVYNMTTRAAGSQPLSFADYPASPVPHTGERLILFILLAGMLMIAVTAFLLIRRYSLSHPELLDTLVARRQDFEAREASTAWEQVGFHRPLGGFLLAFMLGVIMFIPLIIYQNLVLPVYILPSAQALGIWGRVTQFFNLLWLLFDVGTSAAFIKFFSQYRVHDPRKAVVYGQVYVWWQALSGAIQVALVAAIASTALPRTAYALYAWSVIIHTFIQIPGFYQVMKHTLRAWQRSDYAQILELGTAIFFPILLQPLLVTLMVLWGKGNPVFGRAMGGLLGLGLAAYAAELSTFLLGIFLYRRLGYNTRLLFLAHFDWATVKSAFRFGVFEMLGSAAWALGQSLEILITQTRLVNYTEVWGNWGLAQNFIFAFGVIATLYDNLMPAISEAISNAYRKLSQYYSVMAYKWGGLMSAFIGAVLLAVADRFILGASGPEFTRAAAYAIPLIIWGAIQYPSWVGDNVQRGSNHPNLIMLLVGMEQTIRIVLALLLVQRFQINALIFAYFVGLFTKDIVAYLVNHRLCYPQRFYAWQSLIAPLLAGAAHYVLLRWATGLIWQGDQVTSILIFLIGILFSYPVFAFFYGLFGGWDDDTLAELKDAVPLTSFMRPLAWLFWASTRLGARISPLHGRFPIDIRPAAMEEAQRLMQERVKL